ncbi:TldD/PmbA family protein, partial [bacterium]|nr:TldD/PmbA family protein [bacterium]
MSAKSLKRILDEICISSELKKAEWIGLREVRERHRSFVGQDGKIRDVSSDTTHGIMVEVFFKGQMGYAASPSLNVGAVLESAIRALRQAQAASKWSVAPFELSENSPRVRPVVTGHYSSPKSVGTMSPAEISELVVMMSGRMQKSPKIVQTLAYIDCLDGESRLVSTSGTEIEQELEGLILHFQATAQDGAITQKRSDGENLQGNQQYLVDSNLLIRVDRVAEQALELLSAQECPNETTSVVLMPSQMT